METQVPQGLDMLHLSSISLFLVGTILLAAIPLSFEICTDRTPSSERVRP